MVKDIDRPSLGKRCAQQTEPARRTGQAAGRGLDEERAPQLVVDHNPRRNASRRRERQDPATWRPRQAQAAHSRAEREPCRDYFHTLRRREEAVDLTRRSTMPLIYDPAIASRMSRETPRRAEQILL